MSSEPSEGPGRHYAPGKKKILVVDDDRDVRNFVRAVLEKNSFTVFEETNARSLLRNVFDEEVDPILLDILMPGMDGINACRAIKKNVRKDRDIPILMLTRKDDRETILRAIKAGVDDYILKPVSPDVPVEKLRKHLAQPSGIPPAAEVLAQEGAMAWTGQLAL